MTLTYSFISMQNLNTEVRIEAANILDARRILDETVKHPNHFNWERVEP